MKNVLSKLSGARVFFFSMGKFLSLHTHFLSRMAKILSSMLYQAVRGRIILDLVTFQGYVTFASHGNFIQTNVVYLAWL